MKLRLFALAGLAATVSACTTVSSDPIGSTWNGKPAGTFFAKYGPPLSDDGTGSVFVWKGGYKRVGGQYKSCSATVAVDGSYHIRDLKITGDRQGEHSPSYCRELLAPDTIKVEPKAPKAK